MNNFSRLIFCFFPNEEHFSGLILINFNVPPPHSFIKQLSEITGQTLVLYKYFPGEHFSVLYLSILFFYAPNVANLNFLRIEPKIAL